MIHLKTSLCYRADFVGSVLQVKTKRGVNTILIMLKWLTELKECSEIPDSEYPNKYVFLYEKWKKCSEFCFSSAFIQKRKPTETNRRKTTESGAFNKEKPLPRG